MEKEIVLKLTLGEANYLSELLGKNKYDSGSDYRYSIVEKLEGERRKALEVVVNKIKEEL